MYTKPFYIAVDPVGSRFAKALQQGLEQVCHNVVYRVDHQRAAQKERLGRKVFRVTQQTLNKIGQFNAFKENTVSCPGFACNEQDARRLSAKTLFARTLINSTNGRGIVEFNSTDVQYPRAPLYTEYIPKKAEFRVHVFGGQVVDIQQKRKKKGFEEERNTRVRNVANGYVYCRDGVQAPEELADLAVRAVVACGYAYGAVDIIYNEKQNKCFALEVNSRPGLMSTTLNNYCNALVQQFDLDRK